MNKPETKTSKLDRAKYIELIGEKMMFKKGIVLSILGFAAIMLSACVTPSGRYHAYTYAFAPQQPKKIKYKNRYYRPNGYNYNQVQQVQQVQNVRYKNRYNNYQNNYNNSNYSNWSNNSSGWDSTPSHSYSYQQPAQDHYYQAQEARDMQQAINNSLQTYAQETQTRHQYTAPAAQVHSQPQYHAPAAAAAPAHHYPQTQQQEDRDMQQAIANSIQTYNQEEAARGASAAQ